MTSKIKEVFSNIKAENRKALITYIVSGDPDTETTIEIMNSMVRQGTDIIELGILFQIRWQKVYQFKKVMNEH